MCFLAVPCCPRHPEAAHGHVSTNPLLTQFFVATPVYLLKQAPRSARSRCAAACWRRPAAARWRRSSSSLWTPPPSLATAASRPTRRSSRPTAAPRTECEFTVRRCERQRELSASLRVAWRCVRRQQGRVYPASSCSGVSCCVGWRAGCCAVCALLQLLRRLQGVLRCAAAGGLLLAECRLRACSV